MFSDLWSKIKKALARTSGQRPLVILIISLLITGGALYLGLIMQPPQAKPLRSLTPAKKVQKDYLICVARRQVTTGYTEPEGGPLAASARNYYVGSVAVHPLTPTPWGGDPRNPIIPFGTEIHLLKPKAVLVAGRWFNTLTVLDTGDVDIGLWPQYPYWFDIYFGPTAYWNTMMASRYGTKKIDYYWIEEWR